MPAHINKGDAELERLRAYIMHNPARWVEDEENPFVSCQKEPAFFALAYRDLRHIMGRAKSGRVERKEKMSKRICPWWLGYWLLNPLRRFIHNPDKILSPYVTAGMTVLEIGPGMGFFSLSLARMVGVNGKVICVDVQEKMLRALQRRATAAGLADRIVTRLCTPTSLGLDYVSGEVDFALAFAVVHELPDPASFFAELSAAMKPTALCLVAEPRGHVTLQEFEDSLAIAREKGLDRAPGPVIPWSRTAVLRN